MSDFNLSYRTVVPELMDQPDLDAEQLRHALAGLRRINRWSGCVGMLWPKIQSLAVRSTQPLRVLDVGSGGGDIAIGLWSRAQQSGLSLSVVGVDVSRVAVDYAQSRADAIHADVSFRPLDVVADPFPGRYDILISSLLMHHLEEADVTKLLAKMAAATGQLMLVDDVRRCRAGYVLAHVACRTLSTSPINRVDGPRSVAGSFTLQEFSKLFHQAGLPDVRVQRRWPFRMLAEWRPG